MPARAARCSRRTCRRARAAATSSPRCAACARSSRAGRRRSRASQPSVASRNPQSAIAVRDPQSQWWREIPAWAQVAAALLFLGVSAGIANLDVRYDANGLSVRTGWMRRRPAAGSRRASRRPDSARRRRPTRRAVACRSRGARAAAEDRDPRGRRRRAHGRRAASRCRRRRRMPTSCAACARCVDESEKRQQRELALRVAEVMRDVNAQRQADLVKIDRTLGVVQNNLGVEVHEDRQQVSDDLLYRASQQAVGGHCERARIDRHRRNRRGRRPAAAQQTQRRRSRTARRSAPRRGAAVSDRPDGARARGRGRARRDGHARSPAGARAGAGRLLVSDNAHARGFRLEGYGVFFDVIVPSFETTLTWSLRTLDQNDLGLDSALRTLQTHVKTRAIPTSNRR